MPLTDGGRADSIRSFALAVRLHERDNERVVGELQSLVGFEAPGDFPTAIGLRD
jgi:hypothetical protein